METQIKELIAIGASITANCQPCLEYHLAKAREAGAGDEEVQEAIAVGKIVRKGAAGKMDRYASEILKDPVDTRDAEKEGDGCRLT